jgi:HSP20 family protein
MSFFPRSFITPDSSTSFHPLFRLLDDFDQYSNNDGSHHHRTTSMKTFSPKFDVKEVGDLYELHGELPGIDQKDVQLEFTDNQTLTVKGRVERHHQSGTPAAGFVEGAAAPRAITETGENGSHKAHEPTVEDEDNDNAVSNPASTTNDVAKTAEKPKEPEAKYWVSERSVGEFSRSFTFPVRVDQDGVKASMKNGILSIIAPKAKKAESRKITIN